jgi:2-keto-4-pentenoate hydratase/2-oxohepta-3-ene-1,7-dioic acid hydratase in catechol pathway
VHVNGELRQSGRAASMIHSFQEIVSSYSKALSLHPGDVILTGTTAGVGVGRTPPVFLAPGDTIVVSSPQLGTLRTPVGTA